MTGTPAPTRTLLERDVLGAVHRLDDTLDATGARVVERDVAAARWWARPLARRLAAREARALAVLGRLGDVPRLLECDRRRLRRTWLEGLPMHRAQPRDPAYFREALRLLRRMHAAGIVHDDLVQPANWLVTPAGRPALVGFRLALRPRYRGRRFRALACDDLRHLLEHKRTYCAERLTTRQRAILARRSWLVAAWQHAGRPLHLWVTRGLLGWRDRAGGRAGR